MRGKTKASLFVTYVLGLLCAFVLHAHGIGWGMAFAVYVGVAISMITNALFNEY